MDNIAHALTGAVLGQTGLKRLSGLAMPALILSANLPDVDAVAMLSASGLAVRRGWTHGPIALAVLPAVLAALLMAYDRWRSKPGKRREDRPPVRCKPLLLLCYIGAASHVLLDLLNTYGIRLLMPFSERWFYGDVLFVVDPWIWLSLGLGYWLARRRERSTRFKFPRPAIFALLAATIYIGAMYLGGRAAERFTIGEFETAGLGVPERVLASPVPGNPFSRAIVVETTEGYHFGDLRWTPWPRLEMQPDVVPTNMQDPAIAKAAARDKRFAAFLYWSRFPFAAIEKTGCTTRVTINDGRYGRRPDDGPFSRSVILAETRVPECVDGPNSATGNGSY